ncbi:DMT family transporter [Seleniivibrio woodruffii]|uniref:DMT family transporter n=1 Tax=Seleniivibrio woodruffii TaxID=1078050 RepID=UPI0039E5659E
MMIYALLISGTFHVGHSIAGDINPVVLTFARFFMGSVIFGIYVGFSHGIKIPKPCRIVRYTFISLCLVIYFVCMFTALRYTTAANTGVEYTLVPVFTTIYGALFLKEVPNAGKAAVLGVVMLGAVWVIAGGSAENLVSLKFNKGDMIFVAGCMGMGMYPVLSKLLAKDEPTPVLTFWTLATGAAVLALWANTDIVQTNWSGLPLRLYLGLGYLTVFTTAVTFFIIQYAGRRLPVSKVMSYIYIIPLFVLAENFLLGNGLPDVSVLPGVLAVSFGTWYFMKN